MPKRTYPQVRIVLHFLKMNVDDLITWALKEIARLQCDADLKTPVIPISILKKQVVELLKIRKLRRFSKKSSLQLKEKVQLNIVLNSFTYIAFQVATIANDKAGNDEPIARIIIDRLGFKAKAKTPLQEKKEAEALEKQSGRASARKRAYQRWQLEHQPVTVYLKD